VYPNLALIFSQCSNPKEELASYVQPRKAGWKETQNRTPEHQALWVYYLLNLLPTNVISRTLDTAFVGS